MIVAWGERSVKLPGNVALTLNSTVDTTLVLEMSKDE